MEDSPQVFIVGKIAGADHFESSQLYVKFSFKVGDRWTHLAGKESGETFQALASNEKYVPFEHPFDVNYSTKSIRGWPKIMIEAWVVDDQGRNSLAGYGIQTVPVAAGEYKLSIPCWRPQASFFDKLIGAYPELTYKDVLLSSESRFGFKTQTTGKVFVEVSVITKDFKLHGLKLN